MTRKDYIAISDALRVARQTTFRAGADGRGNYLAGIDVSARLVADTLAQDNPRFDRERFLTACGVQS